MSVKTKPLPLHLQLVRKLITRPVINNYSEKPKCKDVEKIKVTVLEVYLLDPLKERHSTRLRQMQTSLN